MMNCNIKLFLSELDKYVATIRDPTLKKVATKAVDALTWCDERISNLFKRLSSFFCQDVPKSALNSSRIIVKEISKTPSVVVEFFNPTAEGKIQKVLESLARLPQDQLEPNSFLGKGNCRLTQEELGRLLVKYVDLMVEGLHEIDQNHVLCVKNLVDELAQADDISDIERVQEQIKQIEIGPNFPLQLQMRIELFPQAFKLLRSSVDEVIQEFILLPKLSEKQLKTIERHAGALKNIEIAQKVRNSDPSPLQKKLVKAVQSQELSMLKKMHQKEIDFFKNSQKEKEMIPIWMDYLELEGNVTWNDILPVLEKFHKKVETNLDAEITKNHRYLFEYRMHMMLRLRKITQIEEETQEDRTERELQEKHNLFNELIEYCKNLAEASLPATVLLQMMPTEKEETYERMQELHIELRNKVNEEFVKIEELEDQFERAQREYIASTEYRDKPENPHGKEQRAELERKFEESKKNLEEFSFRFPVKNRLKQELMDAACSFFKLEEIETGEDVQAYLEKRNAEDKDLFHQALQKVWFNHISTERLTLILEKATQKDRTLEMSRCFTDWIQNTLGVGLTLPVDSFKAIDPWIRFEIKKEKQELIGKTMKTFSTPKSRKDQKTVLHSYQTYIQENLKKQVSDPEPIAVASPLKIPSERSDVQYSIEIPDVRNSRKTKGFGDENGVDLLQDSMRTIQQEADLDRKFELISRFCIDPKLDEIEERPLFALEFLGEVAASCYSEHTVPDDRIFIRLEELFNPNYTNNEKFFSIFVRAFVAGKEKISLSPVDKKYLLQLNLLSETPLDLSFVQEGEPLDSRAIKILQEIGRKVQESPVGLEGVDETTLQESFATSQSLAYRKKLDALRAKSDRLSPTLLRYAEEGIQFTSSNDVAFLRRAILFAATIDKKKVLEFVQERIDSDEGALEDDFYFRPSQKLFYKDCLLELDPSDQFNCNAIFMANQRLMNDEDVTVKLIGFARQLVWYRYQGALTCDQHIEWLLCKIGYQLLLETHFSGKGNEEKVKGFLKYAIDQAEDAISHSLGVEFKEFDQLNDRLKGRLERADLSVQNLFKSLYKSEKTETWSLDRRFIKLGTRTACSLDSGILYTDGRRFCELPALVKNHPDVRALELHKVKFSKNREGVFIHSVEDESGGLIPQFQIKIDPKSQVKIQKKLSVNFQANQSEWLEFVPNRSFFKIPYAVENHLKIDRFWIHPSGTIYGYDVNEQLVGIIDNSRCLTIQKNNQLLKLSLNGRESAAYGRKIDGTGFAMNKLIGTLSTIVSAGDILLREDEKGVYIPSLGLEAMIDETVPEKGRFWRCFGPGFEGMTLDVDSSRGYLSFKKERRRKEIVKQEDTILVLERSLEVNKRQPQTLEMRHEIKLLEAQIREEKIKFEEMTGEICFIAVKDPRLSKDVQFSEEVAQKYLEFGLECEISDTSAYSLFQSVRSRLESWMINNRINSEEYKTYQKIEAWRDHLLERFSKNHHHKSFVLSRDSLGKCMTRSLAEALFAADLGLEDRVEELAKYRVKSEVDLITCNLLEKVSQNKNHPIEIQAYATCLLLQNYIYKLETLAKTAEKNSEEITLILNKIESLKHSIQISESPSEPLRRLLGELVPNLRIEERPELRVIPPARAVLESSVLLAKEINTLRDQSILSRFHLESTIRSTAKDETVLISKGQKKHIDKYPSKEEVDGFYLEEFGFFSEASLLDEFKIKKEVGLFGLAKEDISTILQALVDDGILVFEERYKVNVYHEEYSSSRVQAFLNEKKISLDVQKKIKEYLRVFLNKASAARFEHQFLDKKSQQIVMNQVLLEKNRHFEEMLLAKDFLDHFLPEGATLTDLKSAVLTNSKKEQFKEQLFPLQNALIRYLVHKTEWQHLQNIEKAPLEGERNKIELLKTRRQYRTDLLLEEVTTDQDQEEQRIQRVFLFFEEDYGYRCNPMQYKLFSSLVRENHDPESIDVMQARMGFGKTALFPILALVQLARNEHLKEEERPVVTCVVPKAVLQDNTDSFHTRMSHILGTRMIQDREFIRYQIDMKCPQDSLNLMKKSLEHRLLFYKQVRREGSALIQWPEIRGCMEAQEQELGRLICSGFLDEGSERVAMECKLLLAEIRSMRRYWVFDEVDDTLNLNSRKVNYTCGERKKIDPSVAILLQKIVEEVETSEFTTKDELIEKLCTKLNIGFTPEVQKNIIGKQFHVAEIDPSILNEVLLIRALIQDDDMLALARSKLPNTHFGARFFQNQDEKIYSYDPESKAPFLVSVPFEGTYTPKGMSIFDNTEVSIIATLRYYRSLETVFEIKPHLDFLVSQIEQGNLFEQIDQIPHGVIKSLTAISRFQGVDRHKAAKKFYEMYMKNPSMEFRRFFGLAVAIEQVRFSTEVAKSDRYERGSRHDTYKAGSGTMDELSSYFKKVVRDPAADGKMSIEIFGRDENQGVYCLDEFQGGDNYLQDIIKNLLKDAAPDTRAIVDAAGICKSRDGDPKTIAEELWTQLHLRPEFKEIKGIIYYGKDGVKKVYLGPNIKEKNCNTVVELEALFNGTSYFSFYGQKNTRGSDIKQARNARKIMTLDENVKNNEAKQAGLRFRDLVSRASGQKISFAITSKLKAEIERYNDEQKDRASDQIDGRNIARYLCHKQNDSKDKAAVVIFTGELVAHTKQAAAEIEHETFLHKKLDQNRYRAFLVGRKSIVDFVEKTEKTLLDKYGRSISMKEKDQFVCELKLIATDKLNQLLELTTQNNVDIQKFYLQEIEDSIERFYERYTKDLVELSNQDDVKQESIAEVQAEAAVATESEALVDAVQETYVQVDPVVPMELKMDCRSRKNVSLEFLNHIETLEEATYLSSFRERIRVQGTFRTSPDLIDHPETEPHFILYNKGIDTVIFITQEEASLFTRDLEWELVDLRESDLDANEVNIAKIITLHKQGVPDEFPKKTEEITARSYILVEEQKPTLDRGDVQGWIDLEEYGVTNSGTINVEASKTGLKIGTIQIDHTKNHYIARYFRNWQSLGEKKLETAYNQFKDDNATALAELEELKSLLEALKLQRGVLFSSMIQNTGAFCVSKEFKDGLTERDRELPYTAWITDQFINFMGSVNASFQNIVTIINSCQGNISESNFGLINENISNFKNFTNQLVSESFITEASDSKIKYGKDWIAKHPLMLARAHTITWDSKGLAELKPLELVYARILYLVHGGDSQAAYQCHRADCHALFTQTLPNLIEAIGEVSQLADDITRFQNEIQKLQEKLDRFNLDSKELLEAEKYFEHAIQTQTKCQTSLSRKGLFLIEENAHIFDKIDLSKIVEEISEFSTQLTWQLPKHDQFFKSIVNDHQKKIGLSEEEQSHFTMLEMYQQRLQTLAATVERRDQ